MTKLTTLVGSARLQSTFTAVLYMMAITMKNFPLLNEIDEQTTIDNIDWNTNAFQTLLTSNLPPTTVFYYAIDVGLRRLESSLYETDWEATADALNDLSQFLFETPSHDDIDPYLYEAKCQFLMYASISMIKLSTSRHRLITDAKMSCATVYLLLLEHSKSYETLSIKNQYSSCIHSMRCRYLKRMFVIGQWLSTLSKAQFNTIQSNHEQHIENMLHHLFPSVHLRDKLNGFIDNCLLSNNNNGNDYPDIDATSSGFVFIRRFPKFNEKTIEKYSDLMHMGLVHSLNQLRGSCIRKLTWCIWTLCCMIEADRVSLGVLTRCINREHLSTEAIDFEQKPITIESLNEQDVIVFLLLCALQSAHLYGEGSTLHPYLLYSASHLCTPNQKSWWRTAIEQTPSSNFMDHLATIRLDDERINEHPPILVLLETAKILFKTAQILYEQHSNDTATPYEQYAIQYFETGKKVLKTLETDDLVQYIHQKSFFVYSQDSINKTREENAHIIEKLVEECKKITRHCDEMKLLRELESSRYTGLVHIERDEVEDDEEIESVHLPTVLSLPIPIEHDEKHSPSDDSSFFITPSISIDHDADIQTHEDATASSPSLLPSLPATDRQLVDEDIDGTASPLAPFVDIIFTHMNGVNQWINRYCTGNEGIQNDINTIRDRLERLNRATSQMIFSNVPMFQEDSTEDDEHANSEQ